jgi:hypothetical protein
MEPDVKYDQLALLWGGSLSARARPWLSLLYNHLFVLYLVPAALYASNPSDTTCHTIAF